MGDFQSELEDAFTDAGYDVASVTTNRNQTQVTVLDDGAEADDLREVVAEVVDEADILGTNVTTQSADGGDGVNTVIEVRHRPS